MRYASVYLASPPLVVAYALLGKMTEDITTAPLGIGSDGQPVYLRDVWPTNKEIADTVAASISRDQFLKRYGEANQRPEAVADDRGRRRQRDLSLVRWFHLREEPALLRRHHHGSAAGRRYGGARILAELGDSITTDHISPAGSIRKASPAGDYLLNAGAAETSTATAPAVATMRS